MSWLNRLFKSSSKSSEDTERVARLAYAQKASSYLRSAGLTFEFNEPEFALIGPNWRFNLANQYLEYSLCGNQEAMAAMLERHCKMLIESTNGAELKFEEVRNRLIPVVRERMLVVPQGSDNLLPRTIDEFKSANSILFHHVLAESFVVMMGVDDPHQIATLSTAVIDSWPISREELMRLGQENLRAISKESFVEIAEGVYASCWHDYYDTSRILLIEKVEECAVKGHHVAFLLDRSNVLITGSQDVSGIQVILEIYNAFKDLPRTMCLSPMVLIDEKWQQFIPERHHPCYQDIVNAHVVSLATYYAESRNNLASALGDKIHVASCEVIQKGKMKPFHTLTNWTCKSLLPKTEWIAFVEIDEKSGNPKMHGMARWEEVANLLGDKFSPTIEFPPRYYVDSFIDKPILEKLNLVSAPPEDDLDIAAPMLHSYLEPITRAHDIYLEKYKRFCTEQKGKPRSASEVCFEAPGTESEFMFKLMKLDFVLTIDDQIRGIHLVVPNVSIATTEFKLPNGTILTVKPIAWNSIDLRCDTFNASAKPFQDWCSHWLDVVEKFEKDEIGLSGTLHHVTVPKTENDQTTFSIDFGSAPVEAFETLMKLLSELGVANITISSPWNTGSSKSA